MRRSHRPCSSGCSPDTHVHQHVVTRRDEGDQFAAVVLGGGRGCCLAVAGAGQRRCVGRGASTGGVDGTDREAPEFSSIEDICNYLLGHREVTGWMKTLGPGGRAVFGRTWFIKLRWQG